LSSRVHSGDSSPASGSTSRSRRRKKKKKEEIKVAAAVSARTTTSETASSSWFGSISTTKIIGGTLVALLLIPTIAVLVAPYFSSSQAQPDTDGVCEDGHCEKSHSQSRVMPPILHPFAYRSSAQHALLDYYCNPNEACLEITRHNAREYMESLDRTEFGLCIEDEDCVVAPETLREKCQEVMDGDAEIYRIMPVKHLGPTCQSESTIMHSPESFSEATQPLLLSFSAYTHHAPIAPQHKTGLNSFPVYLDRAIHPGLHSLDDKGSFLIISDKDMEEMSNVRDILVYTQAQTQGHDFGEVAFNEKGSTVAVGYPGQHVTSLSLGMNPKKVVNYKKALRYLEKRVVRNQVFFKSHPEQIVTAICKTHKLLTNGLSHEQVGRAGGEFRTDEIAVTGDSVTISADGFVEELIRQGNERGIKITKRDIKAFRKSFKIVAREGSVHKSFDLLTPKQKKLWKMITHFGPPAKDVPRLMKNFAKDLRNQYLRMERQGYVDHIALAAFAHRRIVEIHPFGNSNGRVARAWMNSILAKGGYEPVVFSSDEEYSAAVVDEMRNPGSFARFIARQVDSDGWTQTHREVLSS